MSTRTGKKKEYAKVITEDIKKKIELTEIQQKKKKKKKRKEKAEQLEC